MQYLRKLPLITILFWVAFIVALCFTVPDLAYVWASTQAPDGRGPIIGMAFAIILESVTFYLTLTAFRMKKAGKSDGKRAICYGVIFVLSLLSFYLLTIYTHHFYRPQLLSGAEDVPLYGILPYVASCFPILTVLFSIMSEVLGTELQKQDISFEEFQKRNNEQIRFAQEAARKRKALRGTQSNPLVDVTRLLKEGTDEVRKQFGKSSGTPLPPLPPAKAASKVQQPPLSPPSLSTIEQRMYEAIIMSKPEEGEALLQLSQEQSLPEFTTLLKERYSQYAEYITSERVAHVLAYAQTPSKLKTTESVSKLEETQPLLKTVSGKQLVVRDRIRAERCAYVGTIQFWTIGRYEDELKQSHPELTGARRKIEALLEEGKIKPSMLHVVQQGQNTVTTIKANEIGQNTLVELLSQKATLRIVNKPQNKKTGTEQ